MSLWGIGVTNAVAGWWRVKGWSSTTRMVYTYIHTCVYLKPVTLSPHPCTHTCMQCTILWWLLLYTWPSQLCWGLQEFNTATMAIHSIYVPPTMFNLPTLPHHCIQVSNCCTVASEFVTVTLQPASGKKAKPNKFRAFQLAIKCSSPPLNADMQ